MPGGLPPVLITNTNIITEEIDNTDRVQVEDVAKLWRVYTLNSTHMEDDEGARLENFFWRIWSNPSVMRSIRGNTLARLFITISQGGNRVRTTPVQSPLSTTPTQSSIAAAAAQVVFAPLSPEKSEQPAADTSGSPRRTSDQMRTLPPILKKSRTGSDQPLKSAETQDSTSSYARRDSQESAGALSSPSGPTEKGSKNAGKKRTSFAGAAGTRKARPGTTRKRSSQSSATSEQRKGSQTSPLLGLLSGKTTPKSAMGLPQLTAPAFELPSGSWQDVESPVSSSRDTIDTAISSAGQPSSWLVDKNFRGRFVEHQKRATSSINLAALGKTQSVRFLDEMPEHKRRVAKGKTVESISPVESEKSEVAERSPPQAASAVIEEESDDVSDANDDDGLVLPRTKSQLSMLINKERKYSGSTNLGLEPTKQENRHGKDKSDTGDDDEEEENELLVMARRDNKGKPKDPDQPFKAAAKKGLWKGGGGDDDLGHSRSPPPFF